MDRGKQHARSLKGPGCRFLRSYETEGVRAPLPTKTDRLYSDHMLVEQLRRYATSVTLAFLTEALRTNPQVKRLKTVTGSLKVVSETKADAWRVERAA